MSRLQRDMSRKKRDTPIVSTSCEAIRVIDDWLNPEGAEAMRSLGLSRQFIDIEYGGSLYPSISVCTDEMAETMKAPLGAVVGGEVNIVNSFFRLSGEDVHTGMGNDFRVHWDAEMGDYTAIMYLNKAPYALGGTGFWRHVPTGWTTVKNLECATATYEQLCVDSTDGLAWELHSLVGSQWNRLGIYRSDLIHSQWPLRGWGSTKETSRLVWVCFFDMPPEG